MKEIELKNVGVVTLRELNNDDRELIQNKSIKLTVVDENKGIIENEFQAGTSKKYTFLLSIASAPFFKSKIEDGCNLDAIIKERLIEYKTINHRIIDTLMPFVGEINKIDVDEFEVLKKN